MPGLLDRADPNLAVSLVKGLQQTQGNTYTNVMVQRARAEGLTFEPETITGNVVTLGAGGEVAKDFIDHEVNHFRDGYSTLNNSYMGGLNSFAERFIFASTAEAEPKYAEVAFKYAFKKLISAVFDKLGEKEGPLPGVGKIYELTFGLVEELEKEHERVEKAELQVKARDYVNKYRTAMSSKFKTIMEAMEGHKTELLREYHTVLKNAPKETRAEELAVPAVSKEEDKARIAGPGADYLTTLKSKVDTFWHGIPKDSAQCEYAFAEGWVTGSEGEIESKGGGAVYASGRMRINHHALRKDGDYEWDTMPTEASLAAKAADKMADVLMENIKQGRTINDMQILKQLTIDVEDFVPGWHYNNHFYVHILYRSPYDIESVSTVPSPVDEDNVRKAPTIQQETLKFLPLAQLGKAVTKIVAY